MHLRDGDALKISIGLGLFGLFFAFIAAQEASSMTSTATGSLPDFPNLRKREALEPGFIAALLQLVQDTGSDGDKLAALMDEESGFNPQAGNPNGGATGLIQWMPFMAVPFTGYTAAELHGMSAIDQLAAVRSTIEKAPGYKTDPAMAGAGKPVTLSDDTVLWSVGQTAYQQNAGYDKAGKGFITAGDIRHAVYDRLVGLGSIQVQDGQVVS